MAKSLLFRVFSLARRPLSGPSAWMERGCATTYSQLQLAPALTLQTRHTSVAPLVEAQTESSEPREFYGSLRQVKTSPMKLNLVAKLIRKMSVADALAQVQFCEKKAGKFVEMTLLDTQRKAVKKHGVQPLNLWVAKSFVGKGTYIKRISYHGKGMHGIMHRYYAHYFLVLREGKPPKKKRSIEDHRSRKTKRLILAGPRTIPNSL